MPLLPITERALLHRLAVTQREGRSPSVVGGVARDGALAWSAGCGEMGDDDPARVAYRIGSLTKTFTAVLVLQLRDEGRLDLTDAVGRHLPEVGGSATLAQLLAHTAGLAAERPGPWWERVPGTDFAGLAEALTGEPPRLVAGSRFHYSNVGFGMLGEVVARLRRVSWAEALQRYVLDPLELHRTGVAPTPPAADGWAVHPYADVRLREPAVETGAMGPAGELWSTLTDLGRWAAFLAGDVAGVLRADTLEEMRQPAAVADGDAWTSGFGLGLQLRRVAGRRLVGHGGSMPGFLATIWAEPATGDAAILLANATSGPGLLDAADAFLRVLAEHEPALPRPWQPVSVDPALLELTGCWYWGTTPLVVRVEGTDWLRIEAPLGGRESRFRPIGPGIWVGLDGYYAGERLQVGRVADRVNHLDLATFVLTRQPYAPPEVIPGGLDPDGWQGGGWQGATGNPGPARPR